jgi:AcrR family transcriptional regulator
VARPSQRIDEALLASGRELYPRLGGALSLRALTEHAGANLGMFHYHFKTKQNFLRTLLQRQYEQMFAALSAQVRHDGPAVDRLRGALWTLGRFARENRAVLMRVWTDAVVGDPVATEFMCRNMPRHLGVLLALLDEAEREGAVRALPPMQRFVFLMGAVAMPIVFAAGLVEVVFEPTVLRQQFEPQVMSDAAIRERVELALDALQAPRRQRRADA